VEETGLTLRRLLREARKAGIPPIRIIEHSVRIYREFVRELVVHTMLNAASDFSDIPSDQPRMEEELVQTFVRQLRVIFLGATHWRE